jgi:hypothetical protein
MVANARWIPYVIDQTYADELVPTTGVIAQSQAFDKAGQRYDLFIHTGGDHLAFATEDRFSDVVAALGHPVRTTNPAAFTYDWYPSLSSTALGIGATGDYWLSGLGARATSAGTVAGVVADDAALPARSVSAVRSGPSLVTQPLPGTNTSLSWKLGARAAKASRMTLGLTDVSRLTLDSASARLRTGTIAVRTDGATRLRIAHLRRGTRVAVNGRRVATAGRGGSATVTLGSGRSVVRLTRSHPRGRK